MVANSPSIKTQRTLVSLSIALLMAVIAGLWGFFFAVRPVWSTSAQMQAERLEAENAPLVVTTTQPPTSISWEEAVATFMSTHTNESIEQNLTAFDGIEPRDFFKIREGFLNAPTLPNDVTGRVKLYMIPGKTFFFRLIDFDVPAGPGYQIGLSDAVSPRTARDIRVADYQVLGPMTRFRGNRNILINPETLKIPDQRPTRYKSLVIWNPEYDVVVATASLN